MRLRSVAVSQSIAEPVGEWRVTRANAARARPTRRFALSLELLGAAALIVAAPGAVRDDSVLIVLKKGAGRDMKSRSDKLNTDETHAVIKYVRTLAVKPG